MTPSLVSNLFVFLLATFVGLEVIRRVSPLLHTPLMSLTNAISAISLVGAMLLIGEHSDPLSQTLGAIAVLAASINVIGGFVITDRMLRMFKGKDKKPAKVQVLTLPIFLIAAATQTEAMLPSERAIAQVCYLAASALFVLSLKWMNHPTTARKGNLAGEIGMGLGILGTFSVVPPSSWGLILICMVVGGVIGVPMGLLMPMTAVPQRTALSHSFGGLAVGLIGTGKFFAWSKDGSLTQFTTGVIAFEVLLGFITFTGSLMAFGKLQEILPTRPITYKGQNVVNFVLFGIALACAVLLTAQPFHQNATSLYFAFAGLALVFGVLLIIPIGGADMPTVISLLNSYAGLSASAMGFVLDNKLLILAGALDGSSGLILSIIMCKAMNRSFTNVLFGAFGQAATGTKKGEAKPVRSAGPEEAAAILEAAQKVVIVPGYGMAVAQAQHKVRELYDALTKKGVEVYFAIHPVAGRMPGHMNVLLAEADIPYDRLIEMEDINPEMGQVDVALIIGANDVTNPAARNDPNSPIYGMPILDVDKARTVMVNKRSMSSGFAGIENELYYMDKTLMLFGDAKSFVGEIVKELSGGH
jgi:NAD(P) transhydrogenase subunit beta